MITFSKNTGIPVYVEHFIKASGLRILAQDKLKIAQFRLNAHVAPLRQGNVQSHETACCRSAHFHGRSELQMEQEIE